MLTARLANQPVVLAQAILRTTDFTRWCDGVVAGTSAGLTLVRRLRSAPALPIKRLTITPTRETQWPPFSSRVVARSGQVFHPWPSDDFTKG